MEFTNVLPGVKLVKQDEAGNEEELFVSQNDHVIVKTLNGREIKGIFMQIEFARCLEEDDIVHVNKDNGENVQIFNIFYIKEADLERAKSKDAKYGLPNIC